MGSASCLPSLTKLEANNKQLGGVIDARFLANSKSCDTSGCQFPLRG
jgi:hypothetical protein